MVYIIVHEVKVKVHNADFHYVRIVIVMGQCDGFNVSSICISFMSNRDAGRMAAHMGLLRRHMTDTISCY